MTTYSFHREQFVPATLPEVFSFFERPENLAKITPPSMQFRILSRSPIPMKKGSTIDYIVKIMGIPVHWKTLIRDYEPLRGFVDEQMSGPYAYWHHTHTFREAEGGTVIIDDVRYRMPFGLIGQLVHGLIVRRQLETIFNHRKHVIEKIFGGSVHICANTARVPV